MFVRRLHTVSGKLSDKGIVIVTDFDASTAWFGSAARHVAVCATVAALGLGGCETASTVLGGPQASEPVAAIATPPPKPQHAAKIAVSPIIGAPDALGQQLRTQLEQAAERNRIGIVADRDKSADFAMRGYLVAARDKGSAKISYIWDVTDPGGKRVNRITGEELAPMAVGAKDAWASVTPQITQAIADKVASSLGSWAPSQPKSTPVASAAPATASVATAGIPPGQPAAQYSQTQGGAPAPAAVGAVSGGFPGAVVSGAPGDGNEALASALQRELANSGVPLGEASGQGYRVEGTVSVGAVKDGKQAIQIDWKVKDGKGASVGTVTQKNSIPPGTLDGSWGKTADAAAAAAAQGIVKLLPQQSAARATN